MFRWRVELRSIVHHAVGDRMVAIGPVDEIHCHILGGV